jgi:ribosomal protein S12 methylthiotransferase accessory factor YcaO
MPGSGKLPSELVWMTRRENQNNFMRSTTGQAVGATFEKAFLAGLYEVVERDQATLRRTSLLRLGVYPPRVNTSGFASLESKLRAASLKLYLLYCSCDIQIPVYWTILVDRVL